MKTRVLVINNSGYLALLIALGALPACTTQPQQPSLPSPEEIAGLIYVVKPGDVLSVIALQHGESYRNLARWNDISPPYTIYPGQRLRLTPPPATETSTENSIQPQIITPKESKESKSAQLPPPPGKQITESPQKLEPTKILHWQWPVSGTIIRDFSPRNHGLDISGQKGDPILAAEEGKVVYSGTGIIGYGPLIIIKHDDNYLSVYAHNKRLFVKEGDYVVRGQRIAEMGTNQNHQVLLHFEIRQNGESVNPLPYLPK